MTEMILYLISNTYNIQDRLNNIPCKQSVQCRHDTKYKCLDHSFLLRIILFVIFSLK